MVPRSGGAEEVRCGRTSGKVCALFVGIPDAATIPANFALVAWLVGASVGLTRLAQSGRPAGAAQPDR